MLKMKLNRTAIALIAVVLMLSVFSMTAFAEDLLISPAPAADEAVNDVLMAPAETDAAEESAADETLAETSAAAEETKGTAETTAETTVTTTGSTEKKSLSTGDIVSLAILGVVIVIAAIWCIKNREKVGKYFRSLKSEYKKIVWSPWNQVRKNTLVVIVVVVAVALLIGIADYIFSNGIRSLGNLL